MLTNLVVLTGYQLLCPKRLIDKNGYQQNKRDEKLRIASCERQLKLFFVRIASCF